MNTPSQQQVAFAYGQYLKAHNGDPSAAMADLQVFLKGYSDPVIDTTHPDMRLDKPAMVGNEIFATGLPWFAVVQRAQAEYAERGGPQPSATRIAEFCAWLEQGQPTQQFADPTASS